MSKTKRTGQAARISALEKDLRQLRAGIRKDIVSATHHEVKLAFKEQDKDRPAAIGFRMESHGLGSDGYSEDDDD